MKLCHCILLILPALISTTNAQEQHGDYGGDYYGGDVDAGGYYTEQQQQQGYSYNDGSYMDETPESFAGDTLYQDYVDGKEIKGAGAGVGRFGMLQTAAWGLGGWFVGAKIHSRRAIRKANKKHKEEIQKIYTRYVTDVTALQGEIEELHTFITNNAKQQLRDEFLMADLDGNQLVSRAEFEHHKERYLQSHPGSEHLFPAFEEFDPNHDGLVSLKEHEKYYEGKI